ERLTSLANPRALETALAVTLLAPSPPLLFMGDEWGATEPFPFFCDFKGDLAEAVRQGRRKEFADAYAKHQGEIPDPLSEHTVRLATLDWTAVERTDHRARLRLIRTLLETRKEFIVPRMPHLRPGFGRAEMIDAVLMARWFFRTGDVLTMLANFSNHIRLRPEAFAPGQEVWGGAPAEQLLPWTVHASIGS